MSDTIIIAGRDGFPRLAYDTNLTAPYPGAVLRSLEGKAGDIVSVKDFGAVGNGTTDDTAVIQSALNTGKAVFFPSGTYRCTAKLTSAGKPVTIYTDGQVQLNWTAGASSQGLEFTFSNITSHTLYIGDILLTTAVEGGGTAIKADWPVSATGYARVAHFGQLVIRGADIPGQVGYWDYGVDLNNCWLAYCEALDFYGKLSGTTPLSLAAVRARGTTTEAKFFIRARAAKTGLLLAGFSEGFDISGSIFVACDYALDCSGTSGLNTPGFVWLGGHAANYKGGIRSLNILQGNVADVLIYKRPDSAQNFIAFDLDSATTDWQISDCKVFSLANAGGGTTTTLRDAGINNVTKGVRGIGCDTDLALISSATGFDHEVSRADLLRGAITQGSTNGQVAVIPVGVAGGTTNYFDTLTANSAAPSVLGYRRWAPGGGHFLTANTVGTTITDFTGGFPGDEFVLVANDANTTIQHNSGLLLNSGVNRTLAISDTIRFRRETSSVWRQVDGTTPTLNVVTPKDFGGIGDNSTNDTTAVQAALNTGRPVDLAGGIYRCTAAITSSGKSVEFVNSSSASGALVFTGATAGLDITLTAGDQFVDISDASILTTQQEAGDGIKVNYTPTGFSNRDKQRVSISRVVVAGQNQLTQGWARGIVLTNCNEVDIYNPVIAGRSTGGSTDNTQATHTYMTAGIVITGNAYPTSYTITNLRIFSCQTGIDVSGAAEGINVINGTMIWVRDGVKWAPSTGFGGRPQITVMNLHANVYRSAVTLRDGVLQANITDCTFYHNGGATDVGNLIDIGTTLGGVISDNQLVSYATGSSTNGIVIGQQGGSEASRELIVQNNILGNKYSSDSGNQRFAIGLWLKAGTEYVKLIGNQPSINGSGVSSCITFLQDDSASYTNTKLRVGHSGDLVIPVGNSAPTNSFFDLRGTAQTGTQRTFLMALGLNAPSGTGGTPGPQQAGVALYAATNGGSGGPDIWAANFLINVPAGHTGFAQGLEIDADVARNSPIDTGNWVGGLTISGTHTSTNRIRQHIYLGTDPANDPLSYVGVGTELGAIATAFLYDAGPVGAQYFAWNKASHSGAFLCDQGDAPFSLDMSGTKATAAIRDASTTPYAFYISGTKSSAAIQDTSTAPYSFYASGTKSAATYRDDTTSPYGLFLNGTYATAAIQLQGTGPFGISAVGTNSVACFNTTGSASSVYALRTLKTQRVSFNTDDAYFYVDSGATKLFFYAGGQTLFSVNLSTGALIARGAVTTGTP
jgi:hypothetical protein